MNRSVVPDAVARQPWQMLIPLFALVCLGGAVLYSAAGGHLQPYALSHVIRFLVFLVMAIVISRFSRNLFRQAAYPIYGGIIVLLVLVETIGAMGGGSQRWLNLGFMTLQPSELMKPAIVLVLAKFYESLPASMIGSWRGLVPAGVLIGIPAFLVILQPDLGTALAICFGGAIIMFLAGLPLWWFVSAGVAVMITIPIAFFTLLHGYQRNRVLTFLNPEEDPLGTGYHITQSKIAIGSGGIFGKGFGNGSQSHLQYLPEPHTDFVFATMAEEWGMIGGFFVIAVFGIVLFWSLSVARRSPDRFASLLAAGMTATVFFYVAINLMMVMGLAPVVGIPLPFMSHGGTSMLTNMICIGSIMAVNRWNQKPGSFS
ncbi:rod shape-determining protein RodA [Novosphingobium pentaromativorans]|uniref:Peptidoglycan glycosyltransferase MrdB n=1 Tax=Novosphingobium pentaromativorans US6-1 TaxID=1088721 RepID=G6EJ87_9SPHN|nr:rod shape-determining protein RodA [Novosphingobium pentaromativorans]AIT79044.1 rod shape-determining protein RodA [Novosphingobium pentaromativorans US6-1]EHJ58673.1 rod shape determining protein RodA [Novosphingobium pentaromativorans US6-1]